MQANAARVNPGLWLTLSVGAILRLTTLGRQSLWLDEAFSYWTARRPWIDMLTYLPAHDSHPPLYYLVLHPMVALGGSEWLLRLPSALAGIASLLLIYALGAELFDHKTGLLAAGILALSPLHIWYAQEARMYALVAALTLAAGLFAFRALRTNRATDWILLAVCEGLALWTDVAAFWFMLAINSVGLVAAVLLWRSRRFWPWVIAQALALALYLPWLSAFLKQVRRDPTSWIPPATAMVLGRTLADFAGAYERPTVEAIAVLLTLAAGLAAGARGLLREVVADPLRIVFLTSWLIVPVGVAFLISQPYFPVPGLSLLLKSGRSFFLTRNLIVASFPVYLFLARSLVLARREMRVLVLVVLVALNGLAYFGNTLPTKKADYRAAARIVAERISGGDLIAFAPYYVVRPFTYYYDPRPGDERTNMEDVTVGFIATTGPPEAATLEAALSRSPRAWLISSTSIFAKDTLGVAAAVRARGQLMNHWQVHEVTIELYDLEGAGP